MLTQDASQLIIQNDDDMSCLNGVTYITGTSCFTQDRRIDLPEEFGHAVEEAETNYRKK